MDLAPITENVHAIRLAANTTQKRADEISGWGPRSWFVRRLYWTTHQMTSTAVTTISWAIQLGARPSARVAHIHRSGRANSVYHRCEIGRRSTTHNMTFHMHIDGSPGVRSAV